MKMSEAFPSLYVSAADLQGKVHIVVIESCTMQEVGQNKDIRPVLTFQGRSKGMVLNKTNGSVIADIYGDDTDGWIGKSIQLYPTTTMYGPKRVPCVRVRLVAETDKPAEPPVEPLAEPPVGYGDPEPTDDIPF